jgi:hypothetical protein
MKEKIGVIGHLRALALDGQAGRVGLVEFAQALNT